MPKTFLFIVFIFITSCLFAQKQTSNWFLRNGNRIGFNNKSLAVGTNHNIDFNIASASICDSATGNLLFVSNGVKIYDRNLQVMPALQDTSKNLSSITGKHYIVKMPGNNTKYYLFYPDGNKSVKRQIAIIDDSITVYKDTIKYAIIDMALNGGLGDVVSFNNIITTEKSCFFTTIQKENSDDFWIITHKSETDSFYTFYVNSSGIATIPIVQSVGLNSIKSDYILFAMQPSWDGKQLAIATQSSVRWAPWPSSAWYLYFGLEIYHFDNVSGLLSTNIKNQKWTFSNVDIYGFHTTIDLIFSPNNQLLYLARHLHTREPSSIQNSLFINQYNTKNCNSDTLDFIKTSFSLGWVKSKTSFSVGSFLPYYRCSNFQMGNDGKIYYTLGSEKKFRIINNPNCIGNHCNAIDSSLTLNDTIGSIMPSFHHKYIYDAIKNQIKYKGGCLPSPQTFEILNPDITNIKWDFGDPLSGSNDTSSLIKPAHTFTLPGYYTVKATMYDNAGNFLDSTSKLINFIDTSIRVLNGLPKDTTLCEGQYFPLYFDIYNGYVSSYFYLKPGNKWTEIGGVNGDIYNYDYRFYFLRKQNDCDGCDSWDSITVHIVPNVKATLGGNRNLCLSDSIKLSSNNTGAFNLWSTGDTSQYIWVKQSGIYWLHVNNGICTAKDTVTITTVPNVNFSLPNDTTLCVGQTLLLKPGLTGVTYKWQNGTNFNSFFVNQAGKYWVTITNSSGCSKTDTINVDYITPSSVYLGADTTLCKGDSIKLQPNIVSNSYLWSTGATTPFIYVKDSNKYWVEVKNNNCLLRDTIKVVFTPKPNFTLGKDTNFCEGSFITLNTNYPNASYAWSNGYSTQQINVDTANLYWCEVTKNKCSSRDSIVVIKNVLPKFSLGGDTIYCGLDSISLTTNLPNIQQYAWQDGNTAKAYFAKSSGLYWLEVKNNKGCIFRDSIDIKLNQYPTFTLGKDTTFCSGQNMVLNPSINNASYLWNTADTTQKINVNTAGLYWVDVKQNSCLKRDSIQVNEQIRPVVFLGRDTILCDNDSLILDANNNGANYVWSTGATTQKIEVRTPNVYIVAVNKSNCISSDTIKVEYSITPLILNLRDTFVCSEKGITLSPLINTDGVNFKWNTGNTLANQYIAKAGYYRLTVNNFCGIDSKEIKVEERECLTKIPTAFSPNGDGINDKWEIPSLLAYPQSTVVVFDRYGRKVFESLGYQKQWNGKYFNTGNELAIGTYYYIITPNNQTSKTLSGAVTILK